MDTKNLTPSSAFDMDAGDAEDFVGNIDIFCSQIAECFNYFKKNGHSNPAEKTYQMLASMMIMSLDKLEAEGLFKEMSWRDVYDRWCENDEEFPDDFVDEAEK